MSAGRSVRDLLGALANPGPEAALAAVSPGTPHGQVGSIPLGAKTGAPPWTQFRSYQVIPASAVGVGGQQATLVVDAAAPSRAVTFIAPLVGFSIFIGDAGVSNNPGSRGYALPPGLPHEIIIPGNQSVYAVTDSPVFLTVRLQIAALLVGDRERAY